MRAWKTLQKELILDFNKFLKVQRHTIELPDGRIIHDWPWVISPDFVLVLPVTERGTILLFHQTKYAVEGTTFAPVGGHIEPGEDPFVAAQRELREEMGCESSEWIPFGKFPNNANNGGGYGSLYLALNSRKVCEPIVDDLEDMEMVEVTLAELEQKLLEGSIKAMSWAAMCGLAVLYLKQHPPQK